MQRYTPFFLTLTPAAAQASTATSANSGQIGSAKPDVRHNAFAEESRNPAACAIDELIGNYEVQGLVLLLQRADRAERDNPFDSQHLHAINIGPKVELRWRDAMPAAMPRQERDTAARQLAHYKLLRRAAEGRVHRNLFLCLKSWHGVQPAPSDNADLCS